MKAQVQRLDDHGRALEQRLLAAGARSPAARQPTGHGKARVRLDKKSRETSSRSPFTLTYLHFKVHVSEFLQVGTLFKTLRSLRSLDSRPVKFSLLPARFTEND